MRFDLATFDVEADGFVEECTKIHCIVLRDYFTKEVYRGYKDVSNIDRQEGDLSLLEVVDVLKTYKNIAGHNIIGYDFDIIEKILGIDIKEGKNIIDTLIMSQTLNPDRQLPKGCPTSTKNPVTGRLEKVTPHSVAAWAYRFGERKIANHDWRTFTQNMLDRCVSDTYLQEKILDALVEEAEISLEDLLK